MNLQAKLAIVFFLIASSAVGLMFVYTIQSQKKLLAEVDDSINDVLKTRGFSTSRLADAKGTDREVLEKFIQDRMDNKAVREVSVVSSHKQIVASSNPRKIGEHRDLSGKEMVIREEFGVPDSLHHYIPYQINVPIMRDNKVIGVVQTSLNFHDLSYFIKNLYFWDMVITLIAIFACFGIALFVLYRLNRPLRQLSAAAANVAAGDLSAKIVTKNPGRDTLGKMTASFNVMIGKLAEQKALEERMRHLERRAILVEMASNLAHEIRNPLNLINLTADHLSTQFQPEGQSKRETYNELIVALKAEVKHLNKMV
ncbi:MAG: HAMP domain-containing protein, partial [Chitinivibrionales bacterium]|nr:HAMP domain-containing protein [Chitinivibrionales bacterium]